MFTEGHAIDLECPNVDVLHSNFRDTNYDINNLETLEILLAHKYKKEKLLNNVIEFDNTAILGDLVNKNIFGNARES